MTKVLIVDDDEDLRDMVSLILSRQDCDVKSVDNGSQVTSLVSSFEPDIILMDIYLGDADGRDLCRKLRTTENFKHIPIILYSAGHITAASIQQSLATEFLSKPFDIQQLTGKIKSLCKLSN